MNNQGRAAEILISSILGKKICLLLLLLFLCVHGGEGIAGAQRPFVAYSYFSCAVVYSQGKTMPSLQSCAGTCREDTLITQHCGCVHMQSSLPSLCVCVPCIRSLSTLCVGACWCPLIFCGAFIWAMCCTVQRELYSIVYEGRLHKQGSFNARWGAASLERSTSWTCVLPVQSSLVTLI